MKFMNSLLLSIMMLVIGTGVANAGITAMPGASQQANICPLIDSLAYIFTVLRTLCFAGAAFVLMGWAWTYISTGKPDAAVDDMKKKGVGMIVGFILLFSVGLITMFLPDMFGCGFQW